MPTVKQPISFVIFGGGGDLAWRKLGPALYNLWLDKHLPEQFQVIAIDRRPVELAAYLDHLKDGVKQFSRQGAAADDAWKTFAAHIRCLTADFDDPKSYQEMGRELAAGEQAWGQPAERVFYLATPPTVVRMIATRMKEANLCQDRQHVRVVCEKPFGRDLASAHELNTFLQGVFDESQVYRIDHYLGKETVQNVLALRFANSLFEPVWNRRYVDHVQITVAESVGVEHRGGYYDQSGALRDMIQNHLLQVLCLVAMEPPVSFEADEVRNKRVDVLRAVRRYTTDEVSRFAVRGQYAAGRIGGDPVPAYRKEEGVDPNSSTETFVALKLFLDNWRWQDVPFYMRTGKRLAGRATEVCIQFRPVPHLAFPQAAAGDMQPNRMLLQVQPDEGIITQFQAKRPGTTMRLTQVDTRFNYKSSFNVPAPEGYETLLLDVMKGDGTLFMRDDQVEQAWQVVMPLVERWQSDGDVRLETYPAGSWGPESSQALLARDGRVWAVPASLKDDP
jgi:glucose-6-phosphate 1-dehydrogenase